MPGKRVVEKEHSKHVIDQLRALIFAPEGLEEQDGEESFSFAIDLLEGMDAPEGEAREGLSQAWQWLLLERCRSLPVTEITQLFPIAQQFLKTHTDTDQLLAVALLNDPKRQRLHRLFALTLWAKSLNPRDADNCNQWAQSWEQHDPLAGQLVGSLTNQLQEIQGATLWRITKPVRLVINSVRRVGHIWRVLNRIAAGEGGWASWLRLIWRTGRSHGRAGVQLQLEPLGLNRNNYTRWVKNYATLSSRMRKRIRSKIDQMQSPPTIAVVMPTYNADHDWLLAAIDSVRNQLYPHWHLCIADDASTDPTVISLLKTAQQQDERIEVVFREQNGHIAAATNSALERVKADWVGFLDHDDLLAEHALYEVAKVVNTHPDVALIYSDEDKIDANQRRCDPYFKSDWNYPLFLSHNLITHLAVYRKSIIDRIGGLRAGFDGAQDYDLALRFIEQIRPTQIFHIPKVLYHWRVHAQSTAGGNEAKPYAMVAGERALNEHFARCGTDAVVERLEFGYRPRFGLPTPLPKVSIIIPTRNAHRLVEQCLSSIYARTSYENFEVILVDNGSDDPAAITAFSAACERYPSLRCLRDDGPFNFARLCNAGVAEAQGDVVCLLNNDIEVDSPNWLEELVSVACQPTVGAVGGKLLYPDGKIQHAGVVLGIGGWAGHAHKGFPDEHPGYVGRAALLSAFSAVTGACMVLLRERFEAVGGFDEVAFGVACNDVDLCLRLNAKGWRSVYVPWAVLYHHESATRGYEDTPEKKARFQAEVARIWERWGSTMGDDPAYNPNLGLAFEDFSLAWPPRERRA
jgi:GT2 family glycosyltransferase